MPNTVNTGFALDMQRKLYRWSLSDKSKIFSDLFNLVCDRRTLMHAWRRLSGNAGSNTPGTDGLTRRKVQECAGGEAGFLEEIHMELKEGTYRPEPVRQRLIPKPNRPGQFRPLGIPTLKDRLVQMALKYILEPIFEADFHPTSYGFRRGRNTHDALAAVIKQLHPTNHGPSPVTFILEGDIKGCFDAIDIHRLMDRVRRRIGDRKVLRLVRAFLKAGVMIEGAIRHPATGTPQGGVISPLLANIYLTSLDERYGRWTPRPGEPPTNAVSRRYRDRKLGNATFYMVRYADDFVLLATGSRGDIEAERDALAQFLGEELRLELSKEKTLITSPQDGFVFLGYRVVQAQSYRKARLVGKLRIPREKLSDLRREIKQRTARRTIGRSLKELIWTLNPLIVGWRTYFQYATGAYREFHTLDDWLWRRILRWLKKKHRKGGSWELRKRFSAGTTAPLRGRWRDGKVLLRQFSDGGTKRYRNRNIRIPNGWNAAPGEWFLSGTTAEFWAGYRAMATMSPTRSL
jgi:group II intron reverse transcriptase/maturase